MFHFLLKPYEGPTKANYSHAAIVFAEGLKALGKPFTANIDYFPDPSGAYLFVKGECDATYIVTSNPEDFVTELDQNSEKKLIILDTKDELVRHTSTKFMPYAHKYFMSTLDWPMKVKSLKPFAFAASNRMIEGIQPTPWGSRSSSIAWAHRIEEHCLRDAVKGFYDTNDKPKIDVFNDDFAAQESHWWKHTGRRHSPAYFEFIAKHKYLDANGGYQRDSTTIVQWDSWKVWEGFLAGCLVITADLDYYGITLPERLVPFVHYIPIRYDRLEESYAAMFKLTDKQHKAIAAAGREFALAHYAPIPMANYILSCI